MMDPTNLDGNKLVETLQIKYHEWDRLFKRNEGLANFLIQTANSTTIYLLPLTIDKGGDMI